MGVGTGRETAKPIDGQKKELQGYLHPNPDSVKFAREQEIVVAD